MRLQDVDFPSDPNCYLPRGFRQMMTAALHKASDSPEAEKVLVEQLGFVANKLKSIPAERKADAEAKANQLRKAAAKVTPAETEYDEGAGD